MDRLLKTPKEKASEIIEKFGIFAKEVVDEILTALRQYDEITENELKEIGYNSFLLQNMESDFRYWEKVKSKIKNSAEVDWSKVPESYNYVAMNKDGTVFVYEFEPYLIEGIDEWCTKGDLEMVALNVIPNPPKDWTKAKFKRP